MFDSLIFTRIKQKFDLDFARQRNKNTHMSIEHWAKSVKIGNKQLIGLIFGNIFVSDLFIRSSR